MPGGSEGSRYSSRCAGRLVPFVQSTRSFAAACIACHGFSATTPTKLFFATTRTTPGMSLTERSSMLTSVAPTVGGLTTAPCSMPGTRTLCTNSNSPVAMAGRSTRGVGVPSTVQSRGCLRAAFESSGRSNVFPPTSSP